MVFRVDRIFFEVVSPLLFQTKETDYGICPDIFTVYRGSFGILRVFWNYSFCNLYNNGEGYE